MSVLVLLRVTGRACLEAWANYWSRATWPRSARRWAVRFAVLLFVAALAFGVLLNHKASMLLGAPIATGLEPDGPDELVEELRDGAPTVIAGTDLTVGFSMPPGQVALTFDDGPHPVWTPRILDELDRLGVTATFFVIGTKVADHPDVAREIVQRGHEIANHTFSHPRMGEVGDRQLKTQLELTRLAIVEATGMSSYLYRPPYSSETHNLSPTEADAVEAALEQGYIFVATDETPRDFDTTLTTDELLRDSLPPIGAGGIITLHDGGSDQRANTLAMLEPLVNKLTERGFQIRPIGEVIAEQTNIEAIRPATGMTEFRASALTWLMTGARLVERVAIIGAFMFASLYLTRLLYLAGIATTRQVARRRAGPSDEDTFTPPVTVIMPVYNEAVGIEAAIRSIDATEWPELEILVVDDGSTDHSADIAEALGLERVRVLRKTNGGKASALNAGIVKAAHDIIVMVDGDTVLEPSTIPQIVEPLTDPDVGAVAGNPKIGNVTNLLVRLQVSEYLMSSSLERRILAPAGMITTIPGAIGAWRRSALQEAGLVSTDTLAEDTDLTVAIARGGWKIAYEGGARAWTEAPHTVSSLYKQRTRWTFGTLQVLWKHRRALGDRGAGSQLGRGALPYLFMSGYLLAALAPIMDVVLIVNIFLGNWQFAVTTWAIIAALGVGAGIVASRLDGDSIKPALLVPLQQFCFRPLLHAVTLVSMRRAVMGERQLWGSQERAGGLVVHGGAEA